MVLESHLYKYISTKEGATQCEIILSLYSDKTYQRTVLSSILVSLQMEYSKADGPNFMVW